MVEMRGSAMRILVRLCDVLPSVCDVVVCSSCDPIVRIVSHSLG
jgi:hypothetical protein